MYKKVLLLCLLPLAVTLQAQQLPVYSMYMLNGFILNPAVAGSDGFTTIGLATRNEMLGFENSPKTYVLSGQGRIMRQSYRIRKGILNGDKTVSRRSGRVGIGGYIYNDQNGAVQRTGGSLAYAYHIFIRNTQLSFGISASTFQFKISQTDLHYRNDEYNPSLENRLLVPDITAGTYILTSTSFFGFSIANLFQTQMKDYRIYRHYFIMGGKRYKASETYSYEPSFLFKTAETMVAQLDLQMRFYYKQDYYFGVTYRTGSSAGFILGIKWKKLLLGYAFDYGFNGFQSYSYGAHELNLALKLGDNARRYPWLIRY